MDDRVKDLETRLQELSRDGLETTERVDTLVELAEALVSGDDPQRMIDVAAEARRLAQRLDYRKGEAYGLLYEGVSCCFVAHHEEGLETASQSRSMFEGLQDDFGVAKADLVEGNLLRSIGSFDGALSRFYQALDYFRQHGHPYWEASCYYDIGLLYLEIGDNEKARENFQASIALAGAHSERWLEARLLNGLGTVFKNLGDHDAAIEHHHRSLKIFQQIGNRMGEARALDDIGSIHFSLGDPDMALQFHARSLEIREAINQRRAQSTTLLNIARAQIVRGDTEQAFSASRKALAIAEETKAKPQVYAAHRLLAQVHELRGEHVEALESFKACERVKEEVFNDQTSDRIRKLQVGFAVERAQKEAEIAHLKTVELKEKNDRLEALLQELQATQSHLVQAEKMAALGKLVAGLVHEMNTPMGASNTAMDVCERCIQRIDSLEAPGAQEEPRSKAELQALLRRIQDSHRVARDAHTRMSGILNNLKSFIRLDGSEREAVDLHAGLETSLALLEHAWKDRIQIVRRYGTLPAVECYPGEINQVFMTVLANAVESIGGTGTISIRTSAENGGARVEISDTGSGIEPERLRHLFDPNFSAKGHRVKAGMGLLVSLNIVQKHGGAIQVESTPGVGTTFAITLPTTARRT